MKANIGEITKLEDFKNVYQVFTGEPYNESFTEEELNSIFTKYKQEGYIYGAFNEEECIGLIAIERGTRKEQPVKYESGKTMYLADVAVLNQYRNSGLGTQLMVYGLMQSKKMGYDRIYMRTLEEGKSMSYGIAKKIGFRQLPGMYQDVERNRQDGSRTVEKSIFLDFDLKTLDKSILSKTNVIPETPTIKQVQEREVM